MPAANIGSPLESAAAYVSTSPRPGGPISESRPETLDERADRYQAELQRLLEWAQKNGKLAGELPPDQKGGAEHTAFFDEPSQRWIKATRPPGFGEVKILHNGKIVPALATSSEYLDRLILSNEIFQDDIRIEKIVPTHEGPAVVTSQPNITGEPATPAQIKSAMQKIGFEQVAPETFYSATRQILVSDLGPRNAATSQGRVFPFDAMVQPSAPGIISLFEP